MIEEMVYPQPALAHATTEYEFLPLLPEGASHLRILKSLDAPATPLELGEMPLEDFVTSFAKAAGFPVLLDHKALEESGIAPDTPISRRSLPTGSLRKSLQAGLDGTGLTFFVDEDAVRVVPKDLAVERQCVRAYPVPFDDDIDAVGQRLVELIHPWTWAETGGEGCMKVDREHFQLLISQTEECHAAIRSFMRSREHSLGITHGTPCTRIHQCADKQLRDALAKSLLETCNKELRDQADATAKIKTDGNAIVVQSSSRPFLVYASALVRAQQGVRRRHPEIIVLGRDVPLEITDGVQRRPIGRLHGGMGVGAAF